MRRNVVNATANDLALIAVMRRYFRLKDESNALKGRLEAVRKDAGDDIGRFYDPRTNALHAKDIIAWHGLRKEMDELMGLAATWGRGGSIEGCPAAMAAAAAESLPDMHAAIEMDDATGLSTI